MKEIMRKLRFFPTTLVALLGFAFDNEMEHTNKIKGHSKSMYALNSSILDPSPPFVYFCTLLKSLPQAYVILKPSIPSYLKTSEFDFKVAYSIYSV